MPKETCKLLRDIYSSTGDIYSFLPLKELYHFHGRACVVVNDQLFVIGVPDGDFMAKPGSPIQVFPQASGITVL